ncbi:MAG: hypothetical protein KDG49_02920 [Geminicoccaceae bacterium]|nr:hypothetical protein [Geminicoccaceae bacterium]
MSRFLQQAPTSEPGDSTNDPGKTTTEPEESTNEPAFSPTNPAAAKPLSQPAFSLLVQLLSAAGRPGNREMPSEPETGLPSRAACDRNTILSPFQGTTR